MDILPSGTNNSADDEVRILPQRWLSTISHLAEFAFQGHLSHE